MSEVISGLRALHALSRRRVACQDVTPERLSGLLQEQGSMALLSAEGGPLEAMAGKYSGRRELANVYMQGYSGERLTYDRQSGASYVAERPSLTMVIMSQPVHLRGILTDPLYVGRGLLERFAWVFPPAMVGHRDVTTTRPIPRELSESYSRTVRRLLPSTAPAKGATPERTSLIVAGDAERQLTTLSAWLEPQYRPDGALYEARAWANRLPTLALKVGTLWHLWDAASRNATPDRHVSAEWISRAVRWVREYILPMGLYARGLMGQHPETEAARQILALISSAPSTEWTAREISRRRRALTAERITGGLSVLEEHGWIRTDRHTPSRGGRETVAVSLHPKIKVSPLGQSGHSGHSTSFLAGGGPIVPFVPIVRGGELRKQHDEPAGPTITGLTPPVEDDDLTPLDELEGLPL